MGEVVKLKQYGKGGWQETHGRIYTAIASGQDFVSGSFRGGRTFEGWREHPDAWNLGRLPEEWREEMKNDRPDYVLWSYGTPIAWHYAEEERRGKGTLLVDRWVIPEVKYSATTTRHQNLVRSAMVLNGSGPYRERIWAELEEES